MLQSQKDLIGILDKIANAIISPPDISELESHALRTALRVSTSPALQADLFRSMRLQYRLSDRLEAAIDDAEGFIEDLRELAEEARTLESSFLKDFPAQ